MNDDYEIEWTALGLAFAKVKASQEEIERKCREELAVFLPKDEPVEDFAHTIVLGDPDENVAFFVEPGFDRNEKFCKVTIDACVWEEGPLLTKGPFKGKKVMLPRPATKYREDL